MKLFFTVLGNLCMLLSALIAGNTILSVMNTNDDFVVASAFIALVGLVMLVGYAVFYQIKRIK